MLSGHLPRLQVKNIYPNIGMWKTTGLTALPQLSKFPELRDFQSKQKRTRWGNQSAISTCTPELSLKYSTDSWSRWADEPSPKLHDFQHSPSLQWFSGSPTEAEVKPCSASTHCALERPTPSSELTLEGEAPPQGQMCLVWGSWELRWWFLNEDGRNQQCLWTKRKEGDQTKHPKRGVAFVGFPERPHSSVPNGTFNSSSTSVLQNPTPTFCLPVTARPFLPLSTQLELQNCGNHLKGAFPKTLIYAFFNAQRVSTPKGAPRRPPEQNTPLTIDSLSSLPSHHRSRSLRAPPTRSWAAQRRSRTRSRAERTRRGVQSGPATSARGWSAAGPFRCTTAPRPLTV